MNLSGDCLRQIGDLNRMLNNNISDYQHYISKAREIENIKDKTNFKNISINFYSNFTAKLLDAFFKVEFFKISFLANINYYSYGQIEENIFDKNTSSLDINFFHYTTEDIFENLSLNLIQQQKEQIFFKINEKIDNIIILIKQLRKKSDSVIFLSNFSFNGDNLINIFQNNLTLTELEVINKLNEKVKKIGQKFSAVYIYDYNSFVLENGFTNIIDKKLWYMSKIPFKLEYQSKLIQSYIKAIKPIYKTSSKCLVLDLDNTLWGGILGEDNIESVKLSDQFPGNIYKDFQKFVLNLREIGVLLAIASKNNLKDVLDFMNRNDDCLIKEKHLSSIKVNWNEKAQNIKEIANELNIGLDAIVFFDDNPIEREWVRTQLPQVTVLETPKNPIYYKDCIIKSCVFDKISITEEDRKRSFLYADEKKRKKHQKSFKNYDDFIKNLNMVITIKEVSKSEMKRVTQLTNKVNQFNLTTKRLDESQILQFIETNNKIFGIRLKDKFGDLGLVGVLTTKTVKKHICHIDNFLLSCRALGRKVENETINFLLSYLKKNYFTEVKGTFNLSKKNMQAKDFYKNIGFKFDKIQNNWFYDLSNFKYQTSKIGKVEYIE